MMTCLRCGIFTPDTDRKCPKCGAVLAVGAIEEGKPSRLGAWVKFACIAAVLVALITWVTVQNSHQPPPVARAGAPQAAIPAPPPAPTGTQYTKIEAPCAPGRTDAANMVRALVAHDYDALVGLHDRGKVLALAAGTRFEVSDVADGLAWGFVRSGREIGQTCYVPASLLQAWPPLTK